IWQVLRDARVEIVRALRRGGVIDGDRRLIGRTRELLDVLARNRFKRWRRKITGIGRVQGRPFRKIVGSADPRAELVGTGQAVVKVKARAVVDREMLNWTPLVLQVDAVIPRGQSSVIDNCDGVVTKLHGRVADRRGKDQRVIVDLGTFTTEIVAGAKRVGFYAGVREIALGAARPIAAKRPRGDAVVNQVTRLIRMER